jgi:hypothetical protein
MFQDAMDLTDTGLLELRWRLEAYADARLTPSVAATTRMRTSVMNAAHRRAALVAADPTFDASGATTTALAEDRARATTNAWRRPVAAILAGFLTLGILVGAASAAKPGGPLYDTRIWIEMANLPADLVARAHAEIGRLEARLQEAQQASNEGDGPAAEAALSAYSVIVIEAADGSAGDATASAAIEISVSRHVVTLTMLVDSVPLPARAAVQNALSSSTQALDDLDGESRQDRRGRPVDADVSGASRPEGTKPDRPIQANGTSPGAATEEKGKPDKVVPARDHDSPPPGQSRPAAGSKNVPTVHPTGAPVSPDGKSGADSDGEP